MNWGRFFDYKQPFNCVMYYMIVQVIVNVVVSQVTGKDLYTEILGMPVLIMFFLLFIAVPIAIYYITRNIFGA